MNEAAHTIAVGSVTQCRRYPVKSLQGLNVEHLEIDPTGVDGDRSFGILDVETGRLLSAKRLPDLLMGSADDQQLRLPTGETVDLRDPSVDLVLSAWLGRKVRLVSASSVSQVSYDMTLDPPNDSAEYYEIPAPPGQLVDLAPLHAVFLPTMEACRAQHPDLNWDLRRFRPNLVFDVDIEPFGEQDWVGHTLEVGSAILSVASPTVRCAMPLRAQPDGLERQSAMFKAMNELNTAWPNHLGLYLDVVEPGRTEVGDRLTVR